LYAAEGCGVSGPRNPKAVARKAAQLEQVRAVMLEHARKHPLRRPLSGKELQARFPYLALSTLLGYVAEIYDEAEAEAADGHPIARDFSNSFAR
jgi:hypothetical protein